jgi:hypothetical protein
MLSHLYVVGPKTTNSHFSYLFVYAPDHLIATPSHGLNALDVPRLRLPLLLTKHWPYHHTHSPHQTPRILESCRQDKELSLATIVHAECARALLEVIELACAITATCRSPETPSAVTLTRRKYHSGDNSCSTQTRVSFRLCCVLLACSENHILRFERFPDLVYLLQ